MKIFIGLTEVAGYFSNLKKGFSSIGIDSTFVDINKNKFNYSGTDNDKLFLLKYIFVLRDLREKIKNRIINTFLLSIEIIIRIFFFIQILFTHDVFIFSFATTFFKYKELPILKFFNKKIIYIFLGSDSRPPYIDGFIIDIYKNNNINDYIKLINQRKYNIKIIDKYSDFVIDHIPQALFHEKPFIPLSNIGIPYTSNYINNFEKKEKNDYIKILHSPSNPEVKGSNIIKDTIEKMIKKGYKIEYIEIIGKPNSYVIEKINECDFIIDQIYSDTPLAGFATEAAFFGKPVIVCGYYQDFINKYTNKDEIPPSIFCQIEDLEFNIEKLINNKELRLEIGSNLELFVKNNLKPEIIASKILNLINNKVEKNNFFDPNNIDYIYGGGVDKIKLKKLIKNLVDKFGIKSLQLSDKPHLEKLFLDFVKEE